MKIKNWKKFNENVDSNEIVNNIEDILLPLNDDGIKYYVESDSNIEISFSTSFERLDYIDEFKMLFDYMNMNNYKLSDILINVTDNDIFDCPECGERDIDVELPEVDDDEYYSHDYESYYDEPVICPECDYQSSRSDFIRRESDININEFFNENEEYDVGKIEFSKLN